MWMSGYMLEWMLSCDNLFVFRIIFLSIIGAVISRLVIIFVDEYLMHTMFFRHIVFGTFFVYTGVHYQQVSGKFRRMCRAMAVDLLDLYLREACGLEPHELPGMKAVGDLDLHS